MCVRKILSVFLVPFIIKVKKKDFRTKLREEILGILSVRNRIPVSV